MNQPRTETNLCSHSHTWTLPTLRVGPASMRGRCRGLGLTVFGALAGAITVTLASFVLLFVLVLVLRREWLAVGVWIALDIFSTPEVHAPAGYLLLTLLRAGGVTALIVVVLLRFGLLSAIVTVYFVFLLAGMPITADVSAW